MNWKDDAREFGLHVKQGGWRLGLLVARNVEPPRGQGSRTDTFATAKVSANAFAKASGTSADRVLRYLGAWERAAEAGHVPPAVDLIPESEPGMDVGALPPWDEFYTSQRAQQGRSAGNGTIELPQTKDPEKLQEHFEQHPASAERVTQALTSTPEAASRTYKAARKAMIEQARGEPAPSPKPDAKREHVIRIEAIADEVIRGLAEVLDPDTDPLGQRLALLEQNLSALSEHHRQRLARAVIELGARVSAWEDRVRGLTGHTVAG